MPNDQKGRVPPPGSHAEPYIPGDPIPAPHAVEKDSDSIWDLWHKTHRAHEAGFAPTAPASIAPQYPKDPSFAPTEVAGLGQAVPRPGALPPGPRTKPPTVDDAMLEARRNNRVCPCPPRWQELYQMLPNRQANTPTPPLVGAAWNVTPSISKRMCLREHLEWAGANAALDEVLAFLKRLPEEEWLHMGE